MARKSRKHPKLAVLVSKDTVGYALRYLQSLPAEGGEVMEATERIPRMRTAAKIVAEIKALDPDTEVTEFHIRKLAKEGTVPVVWAGRKALINLNDVLDLMRQGITRPTDEVTPTVGGIRHIDPKL